MLLWRDVVKKLTELENSRENSLQHQGWRANWARINTLRGQYYLAREPDYYLAREPDYKCRWRVNIVPDEVGEKMFAGVCQLCFNV